MLDARPDHKNRQILAGCYFRAGRIEDAIVLYEKMINRYDRSGGLGRGRAGWPALSVITYYNLGKTYEAAGRYDEAIKQYETFLDIWKNADEGLESVVDANERLAKLKHGS